MKMSFAGIENLDMTSEGRFIIEHLQSILCHIENGFEGYAHLMFDTLTSSLLNNLKNKGHMKRFVTVAFSEFCFQLNSVSEKEGPCELLLEKSKEFLNEVVHGH